MKVGSLKEILILYLMRLINFLIKSLYQKGMRLFLVSKTKHTLQFLKS
jgi:hypothetical protein